MLHTFTYRINLGIKSLHGIVDHDAALTMQASPFCQGEIRAYARP